METLGKPQILNTQAQSLQTTSENYTGKTLNSDTSSWPQSLDLKS